jgi:alpha-beta hydrolase superfamily lysophospholipase
MRRAAAAALCLLLGACVEPGGGHPPPGEAIRFTTDDGVELAGEVRGSGDLAVVLLHMYPADRGSWAPFASRLANEGYTALSFDFRGYGESGGAKRIDQIWRDALAAVRFMRSRGHGQIALVGASMGGTAALIVAARADLAGVVTLSAASSFRGLTIPPEALTLIDEPTLFLAAQGDVSAATTAQELYAGSPGGKEVQIVAGSEHGTELLHGDQAGSVQAAILDFLQTDAA